MGLKIPKVMIAAVKSGSGKTTVTCAFLKQLLCRKKHPVSFKCGPDYIDPMFHEQVLKIPSKNLDTFFSDVSQIQALYEMELPGHDIAVLEGVMGLYDGLGGIREEGSSYHLAKTLDVPVILVVDAHGMGKSVIPLIAGFLQYDEKKLIKGVILNRTSKMFFDTIAPLIEEELAIKALGCIPNEKELTIGSRHLGLILPEEKEDLEEKAYSGKVTIFSQAIFSGKNKLYDRENSGTNTIPPRIAVAKDEAFCFYYRDNLRMLEHYGAELVFFSPLHDEKLPENIHGLLLGGGYPELYAKQLEENESMRKSIKEALEQQLPSLAECGGFMYLHDTLTDREGTTYQMAGVIPAECQYTGKLVRFGYVEVQLPQGLTEKGTAEMPEPEKIKAHEFHYFDSTANGEDCIATKPVTGRSWKCIHASDDHFWGFPHLYYPSDPKFVEWFLERTEKHI